MGLDVYLHKCDNLAKKRDLETQYEKKSDELWSVHEKYEDYTEEEKEEVREQSKEYALSLGLNEDGEYPEEDFEFDSKDYPEHYFKVGYFRSSYNDSGINSVARRYNLPDLYDIFAVDDEYIIVPDWDACLKRVESAIEKWGNNQDNKYDCFDVSGFLPERVDSEKEALEAFKSELERHENSDYKSFSNKNGVFYLDGVEAVAFIHGKKFNTECLYVVYKADQENYKWYVNALEIVKETINFVLAQPDKEKYYLRWSG